MDCVFNPKRNKNTRRNKPQALIPDCTTVDSPFVRPQPRSSDSPVRIYQRQKLCQQQHPGPLLCEKVLKMITIIDGSLYKSWQTGNQSFKSLHD